MTSKQFILAQCRATLMSAMGGKRTFR
jgi:hypothetical protein